MNTDHRNFQQEMRRAKMPCFNSGHRIEDDFVDITEIVRRTDQRRPGRRSVKYGQADSPIENTSF